MGSLIDTSSLFLHVLAAVGILSGSVVQVLAGLRLRAATSGAGIVTWAGLARTGGRLVLGSAVVSLLTGGHLAGAVWTTETTSGFAHPFVTLGLVGLVVLAPVGPVVGGRRLRRLLEAAPRDEAVPDALRARARSPRLWGPVHSLAGVGVGLVALMVYKPGWIAGAVLLLASFAAGWLSGIVLVDGRPDRPAR